MAPLLSRVPTSASRLLTRRGLATAASFDPAVYPANVVPPYAKLISNLDIVKKKLGRPLTLAEKIVYSHLSDPNGPAPERGVSYLKLSPGGFSNSSLRRVELFSFNRLKCQYFPLSA
jgi:hypothetical protein